MRENMGLYRGKRTGDGEWVEGYLTYRFRYDRQSRKEILGPVIDCPQEVALGNTTGKVICSYQVAPCTEGRFTGMTDKNGTKIFEGDIVRDDYEDGTHASIVWLPQGCGWYLSYSRADRRMGHRSRGCSYTQDEFLEVIGNIHDNPELLEVK